MTKIWSVTKQEDVKPEELPLKDLVDILDHISIDVSKSWTPETDKEEGYAAITEAIRRLKESEKKECGTVTSETTESKECYGDHFKCNECGIVEPGWKSACKRQCEYEWEHRARYTARPGGDDNDGWDDDDDGWDIAGQYRTSY